MAKMGNFAISGMKELQQQLNKIQQGNIPAFVDACAKELAARLLRKVIKKTLPGRYDQSVSFTTKDGKQITFDPKTGKKGGTLRRGWTSKTHEEAVSGEKADAKAYANSLTINHSGNILTIEIVNPVEYALT